MTNIRNASLLVEKWDSDVVHMARPMAPEVSRDRLVLACTGRSMRRAGATTMASRGPLDATCKHCLRGYDKGTIVFDQGGAA